MKISCENFVIFPVASLEKKKIYDLYELLERLISGTIFCYFLSSIIMVFSGDYESDFFEM